MPGFLERDEGEREPPCEQYPWDGISGMRPFRRLAEATTVGVYTEAPSIMINLPVIRWGKPYDSLEVAEVNHFATGEPIAKVSQAGGGIIKRDMRQAQQARDALLQISCDELIAMLGKAADLYEHGTLPMGDGTQSPDDFVHQQSASTGLPEHMCRANMAKNSFVLKNMEKILDCLTRGLDLEILSRGYGEEGRGVTVSYQAQSPVLVGGAAFEFARRAHAVAAGRLRCKWASCSSPGRKSRGRRTASSPRSPKPACRAKRFRSIRAKPRPAPRCSKPCERAMIFGGTATVDRYRGNPESAGARPRLLQDPARRRRRRSLARLSST